MKSSTIKLIFTLVIFIGIDSAIDAQGVSVSKDGSAPNPNAILDVSSDSLGVLIPRLDLIQKTDLAANLTSTENGLLIFYDGDSHFYFWQDTSFRKINATTFLSDNDMDTRVEVEHMPDDDLIRFFSKGTEFWQMRGSAFEPHNTGHSIFIGQHAGRKDDLTNNHNIAIGKAALFENIGMDLLIAIGDSAMMELGKNGPDDTGRDNIAIGSKAMAFNGEGQQNTAVGHFALAYMRNGFANTAIGRNALRDNIIGNKNTGVGTDAMGKLKTGDDNVAIGANAALNLTSGSQNIAVGVNALLENTNGNHNVAIGHATMYNNSQSQTVAIGDSALAYNGMSALPGNYDGQRNTAVGSRALKYNDTGGWNTAVGSQALYANEDGFGNSSFGARALINNTAGDENCGYGNSALLSNTTGIKNVAVGVNTMYHNESGSWNTAVGTAAGNYNTGSHNTAVGYGSLGYNDRSELVAVGSQALLKNGYNSDNPLEAIQNTAVGTRALRDNFKGWGNTGVGYQTMQNNTVGNLNTAMGVGALAESFQGDGNSVYGTFAMYDNIGGDYNTAIGQYALYNNENGDYNTAAGVSANSLGANYNNSTGLGYNADCTASNQVRIGNSTVGSIGGYANWTNVSDGRFKSDVAEDVKGLEFIKELRPVTYNIDLGSIERFYQDHYGEIDTTSWEDKYAKEQMRMTGFIAQEVEQAAATAGYDFSGVDKPKNDDDYYGLRYAEFVVPLVKAVQELSAQNDALRMEVEELKQRLR